jgi:tetratricopeptide (TPR) repeat protein
MSTNRFACVRGCLLLALLAIVPTPLVAAEGPDRTAAARDVYELGEILCDEGRMAEALPIYQQITKSNPEHGFGWLGLGWSLHYMGKFAEAIPAYERAIRLGATSPWQPMLEIARCHVAMGNKAEAIRALERAMDAGLPRIARLRGDGRLASLRDEPRFRELAAMVDTSKMTREAGWRYDLALLAREVKRLHFAPFRHISRDEFDASVREIEAAVPASTDDDLAVRVMKLMARLGDGHTYAEAPFERHGRALPVLFEHFEDGIFVTAAAPGHEDLLWARVVRFDASPVERVFSALDQIVSRDNSQRLKAIGPRYMRYPQLLKALGIVASPSRVDLAVVDRHGRERVARLEAGASTDTVWARKPADVEADLPRYARDRDDNYWFTYLAESRTVYFQYNAVAEKDGESIEAFAAKLFDFVDRNSVDRLVIDLRWNGGGNLHLSKPLLAGVAAARKVNQPGKLFVIAGRHTFSAAMVFAAQLERYTEAIFVGEPTGSSPNFVGETNFVELPWSRVTTSISNLYWQSSYATDRRTWIAPKIPVLPTFESYRAGLDPALEAILAYTPLRPRAATAP